MPTKRRSAEKPLPPIELAPNEEQPPLPGMPEPVRCGGHVLRDDRWVIEEK